MSNVSMLFRAGQSVTRCVLKCNLLSDSLFVFLSDSASHGGASDIKINLTGEDRIIKKIYTNFRRQA